ncbi:condensation domain-containing protein [Aurantibacter sp.]|uniref:condensation domain-containing protein n=1 Tax=Aurantibacter sp. TaxID=2807103 RepID=UPI0032641D2D
MKAVKKPKIEAIFPLTYMQQGLLFHHLSSENDQGFLNVECTLLGEIDVAQFEKVWNKMVQRHAALRTTVHWKNLAKPVTIVHLEKSVNLNYFDWSKLSSEESLAKWDELKLNTITKGVNLEKEPLLNLTLLKFKNNDFRFLWPSHHLLIDGWSSQVILNDFLTTYDAVSRNLAPSLPTIPSLKSYYAYKNQQSKKDSEDFWKSYFKNTKYLPLFDRKTHKASKSGTYHSTLNLNYEDSKNLQILARRFQVTMNTLVQGAWSYLISRYFGTNEISFGSTVSGRSGSFPNIEFLTGMLMDVQPVRVIVENGVELSEWLRNIQKQQHKARLFEHGSLDEITSFIDWPEAKPIFDNLLIFENFPQTESTSKVLEIRNFKSGITSTYPVTLVVIPGDEIKFNFTIEQSIVDEKSINWILGNWKKLIQILISNKSLSFDLLDSEIEVYKNEVIENNAPEVIKYVAPQNETELQLIKIWEDIFGSYSIGVDDNFFSLGGKSLMAIKMFNILNKRMGLQLPPTTLLEHSTISSISNFINNGSENGNSIFRNLVPVRAKGNKPALFCVHAGDGHVFFYNLLAKYLDEERPVYALQPSGIFDNEDLHINIEEMAISYVNEIKKVQAKGPYNLLVYCFSTAVGLEMSKALKNDGSETNLIVMDTMAEQEHLYTQTRMLMRVLGFLKRLVKNPINVLRVMLYDRYTKILKPFWVNLTGSQEEKDAEMMSQHLTKLYNKYKWQPQSDNIKLVLTEKADKRFNKEYIRSWKEIALNGVDIKPTVGNHRSLFSEPDIIEVAKTIDDCLL